MLLFNEDFGELVNFNVTGVGTLLDGSSGTLQFQATNNIIVQNDFDVSVATGNAGV